MKRKWEFAQFFRESRRLIEATQMEVSKEIGISQGALSKIESGKLIPGADVYCNFRLLLMKQMTTKNIHDLSQSIIKKLVRFP